MKFKKCLAGLFAVLFTVLSFSGCKWFSKEFSPESALPKDAVFVLSVDHSDKGQAENLDKFVESFPDSGFRKQILASSNLENDLKDSGLDYEKDFKPLFQGKWKVAFGAYFPSAEVGLEPRVVLSGWFDDEEKLSKVLDAFAAKNNGYKKAEGVKYYDTNDGSRVVVDGNKFFVVNKQDQFESALKRFNGDEEGFKNEYKSGIVSVFLDPVKLAPLFDKVFSGYGKNMFVGNVFFDILKLGKNVYGSVFIEEGGLKVSSNITLGDDKDLIEKFFPNKSYKVGIVDKVPGKDLMFYLEESSLGSNLKRIFDLVQRTYSMYDEVLDAVSGISGSGRGDTESLFNSPYAISISDGEVFPSIGVYLKVDDKGAEVAKRLSAAMSSYVEDLLKGFAVKGFDKFIRKENVLVNGGGVYKVYIDFASAPKELIDTYAATMPNIDFKNLKLEFYYGVTGDNIFVIALSPDFDKAYGKDTISKYYLYKEAVEKLEDFSGYRVMFLDPGKFVEFADKILKLSGNPRFNDKLQFLDLAKKFVAPVKYFVITSKIGGNSLLGGFFLGVDVKK
ncbi:hypothetical protein HZC20_00850 [Candidatus Peregrinibacteria bacterium]|nr:hypothetical protein [Candidatus Peregrinibacteria bacterium]